MDKVMKVSGLFLLSLGNLALSLNCDSTYHPLISAMGCQLSKTEETYEIRGNIFCYSATYINHTLIFP